MQRGSGASDVAGFLSLGSNGGDGFLDSFLELSIDVAPVEDFHRALQQLLEFTTFDSWAQWYGNLQFRGRRRTLFFDLKIAMKQIHRYTPCGRIAGPRVVKEPVKAFHAFAILCGWAANFHIG